MCKKKLMNYKLYAEIAEFSFLAYTMFYPENVAYIFNKDVATFIIL